MSDILRITGLRATYGKVVALNGVSLSVREGEIVAILGANGAGKSTLLNCISGVVSATVGEIIYAGRPIRGQKPWTLSNAGIAHVPEGREIFPFMTVEENLAVVKPSGAGPAFSSEDVLRMFPRLSERYDQLAGNLSGGEQQMLAIGRGLMTRPKLMLFDEPSLGLSPAISKLVLASIGGLRDKGVSCLLVEQNMRAALRISDRAYVLRTGNVVREGTAATLAAAEDITDAYLGSDLHPA